MEADVYQRMAQQEDGHWWFLGRRRLLRCLLEHFAPPHRPLRILEAGCGTGGNLALLSEFGDVSAFELDPMARERAVARGFPVQAGRLPGELPFAGERFDLIVLFDVLEHIEEDQAALAALRPLLKPGGRLILTVPAFSFLWTRHDVRHHHFRRYSRGQLADRLQSAGLTLHRISYYNCWLFLPIAVIRLGKRVLRSSRSDEEGRPPRWLNRFLEEVLASERFLLVRPGLPFGISLWAVAGPPSA